MHRIVRLRLRTASVLRDEAVHQIENDFFCDNRIAINLRKTFRAKTRTLSEATPVVDVRNCHIVNATGDAIHFADAHYRNIDDLGNFS